MYTYQSSLYMSEIYTNIPYYWIKYCPDDSVQVYTSLCSSDFPVRPASQLASQMPLGELSSCASFWLPTKTWLSQESITKKSAVSWLQFKVSPILLGKPSNQTLTFAKHSPRKSPNHPISLQPPACNIWTDWHHRNQSAALAMGDFWGFSGRTKAPTVPHL